MNFQAVGFSEDAAGPAAAQQAAGSEPAPSTASAAALHCQASVQRGLAHAKRASDKLQPRACTARRRPSRTGAGRTPRRRGRLAGCRQAHPCSGTPACRCPGAARTWRGWPRSTGACVSAVSSPASVQPTARCVRVASAHWQARAHPALAAVCQSVLIRRTCMGVLVVGAPCVRAPMAALPHM